MYQRAKIGGYCHLNMGEEAAVVGLMAAMAAARLLVHELPRARLRDHARHRARPGDGGVFRQDDGGVEGVGRLDAPLRRRGAAARRLRHRRRLDPAGHRRRAGDRVPRPRRPNEGWSTARRRDDEHRRVLRVAELGRDLEAADRLLRHQQPVRMGTPVEEAAGGRPVQARLRVPHPGRARRRQRRDRLPRGMTEALRLAREERQPSILEVVSWRLRGHSVVDPAKYRSRKRCGGWQTRTRSAASARACATPASPTPPRGRDGGRGRGAGRAAVEFADNSPHPDSRRSSTTPTPTPVATAARAARRPAAARISERRLFRGRHHLSPSAERGAARGDAARPKRLSHRRGDRRLRGLVQDHRRPARRSSAPSASATPRSPKRASSAPPSARRWSGLRPVVEIMTINFSILAMDQIVNHAAKIHACSAASRTCRW